MATAAVGDSIFWMLVKQVQALGGTATSTDTEFSLLCKLVVALGGTAISGDTVFWLLVKELRALGGTAISGDTVFWLLYKQVVALGGTTSSNDTVFSLLAKLTGLAGTGTGGSQSITPTGIASTNAFGTATVTRASGPQAITPTGIASTNAFGTATVAPGARSITPTGIASTNAFGTATVALAGGGSNFNVGITAAGSSGGSFSGLTALQVTVPKTGVLQSLTIPLGSGTSGISYLMGLYTDASGVPGTLIPNTQSALGTTNNGGLNTVNVTGGATINAGTYWVAVQSSSPINGTYNNGVGLGAWNNGASWNGTSMVSPFSPAGNGAFQFVMYATLFG